MRAATLSQLLLPAVAGLLAACSGDDETTDSGASDTTCDDIVTAPLGEVPVSDWPDGLPEAIGSYTNLGGRYETTGSGDCEGTIAVKLVPRGQEELQIVTTPWNTGLTCGCVTDPKFGDDTAYPVAALIPTFEFFVEVFGEVGIDNQNVVGAGALFESSAPMSMRECGTKNVDPILGSIYEQFTTLVRVEDGILTGALTLAKTDGTNEVCELSDWVLIEGLTPP